MPPSSLILLAPLRLGAEGRLRETLRAIGNDIRGRRGDVAGRPHIDFPSTRQVHFARFAILDDPDAGPDARRLLYAAVHDGTLDDHLAELVAASAGLDALWGACAAYTGATGLASFVRAHLVEPDAFYIAYRDESVASIRRAIARREAADDGEGGAVEAGGIPLRPEPDWFDRLVRALPLAGDIPRSMARNGIGNTVGGALTIAATLDRFPALRLINRLTGNTLPPRASLASSVSLDNCSRPGPLADGDEIPSAFDVALPSFREDAVAQNQLTLLTVIAPGRAARVRAVLAAIDAYALRLSPAGSLAGIRTIHFVRWVVLDGGRRLLMLSDYDGSWEAYIDEFAEMILSGLDAIWGTALGYPPDGARDLPAFKRFLRSHQVPPELFFSAYPGETLLHLERDLAAPRPAVA